MQAFVSYSHRDLDMPPRLKAHASVLIREQKINFWIDREITAGAVFEAQIFGQLQASQLFIALVSADYLASPYCFERELGYAMDRAQQGVLRIVPIILDACDWKASPLGRFQALPRDGRPIRSWANQSEAFLDVVIELRRLVSLGGDLREIRV